MRTIRVVGLVLLAAGILLAMMMLAPGGSYTPDLTSGSGGHGSLLAWVGVASMAGGLVLIGAGMMKASRSRS